MSGLILHLTDHCGYILDHIVKMRLQRTELVSSGDRNRLGKISLCHSSCRTLNLFDLTHKAVRGNKRDHNTEDHSERTRKYQRTVDLRKIAGVLDIADAAQKNPACHLVCHRGHRTVHAICTHRVYRLQCDVGSALIARFLQGALLLLQRLQFSGNRRPEFQTRHISVRKGIFVTVDHNIAVRIDQHGKSRVENADIPDIILQLRRINIHRHNAH